MRRAKLLWQDYKLFPYERQLAHREVTNLLGATPHEVDGGLELLNGTTMPRRVDRLTYFKGVAIGGRIVVPTQARLEASANGNGQVWNRDDRESMPRLRRQSTRYSAHGLHEYRGKFNPQVVRAIGNLLELKRQSWILDPFCGSGTTLLEAAHVGWNCLGIDLNPLAILIANAKISAIKAKPSVLEREAERLSERLKRRRRSRAPIENLPNLGYLQRWFSPSVLAELAIASKEIDLVRADVRDIFRVVLSDTCRGVSLQDPADLRIRRRKDPQQDYPALQMFVESLRRKLATLSKAKGELPSDPSIQIARLGDSRVPIDLRAASQRGRMPHKVSAAITSPPYATALPYLDTQRLSLCLLGLMEPSGVSRAERHLVGTREIGKSERLLLEEELKRNLASLPGEVQRFCLRLLEAATDSTHGFRRRNVPALVYKYFCDMSRMFESVRAQVSLQGKYVLLVGRNRTTLRGEEILIDTPSMLGAVAESRGWKVEEQLELDTYQRFDLHRRNSITNESLLILRRI